MGGVRTYHLLFSQTHGYHAYSHTITVEIQCFLSLVNAELFTFLGTSAVTLLLNVTCEKPLLLLLQARGRKMSLDKDCANQ